MGAICSLIPVSPLDVRDGPRAAATASSSVMVRACAMIARQVKHLIQTKAMKQMLRQTSAARDDEQPKRITARNGLQ
jgi:hypothetical protein